MSEWKYSYGMVATLLYLITVLLYECDFLSAVSNFSNIMKYLRTT